MMGDFKSLIINYIVLFSLEWAGFFCPSIRTFVLNKSTKEILTEGQKITPFNFKNNYFFQDVSVFKMKRIYGEDGAAFSKSWVLEMVF